MKKIDTLSSLEGRSLLRDIFRELRVEKQVSGLATLGICWKICVHEKEIHRSVKKDYTIVHKLGILGGTALWMEEIVNRFYFSTINRFLFGILSHRSRINTMPSCMLSVEHIIDAWQPTAFITVIVGSGN